MDKIIARVFPRRTKASPIGPLSFFGPPGWFTPKVDEVHISVTFTWDLPRAEKLKKAWKKIAPVKMGGPAFGKPSGEFVAGKYLANGYTITSRGCINKCWFCKVWKREPKLIELPIVDGWNVLDDNLLACSEKHIRNVFSMLKNKKYHPVFSGGLEAKLLKDWHVDLLVDAKPSQMFFAYDTPDDWEPLMEAAKKLFHAGFKKNNSIRCYVLAGFKGDTEAVAEQRVINVWRLGILPMVMVMRDEKTGKLPIGHWGKLQHLYIRPARIKAVLKSVTQNW